MDFDIFMKIKKDFKKEKNKLVKAIYQGLSRISCSSTTQFQAI